MSSEERIVLHCDINHCYAQIEEMKHPRLREVPMAVGGHEEERHGIILTKNLKAKKYGIKTGESLREALAKCPQLMIIHPHYDEYLYYTKKVKDIYREYSNQVESFGLDEAWVDVSESVKLFGSGVKIAQMIQQRVYDELGLTISIGVSFNKIFAKFGSDMIKPSGLVEITHENFKEIVWNEPVEDLFYVGRATKEKLHQMNIFTVGALAQYELGRIKERLGKMGELIWGFANGYDVSQVAYNGYYDPIKSVGNSITTAKDISNANEAKLVFYVLCESVASRLRDAGFKGNVISISLRNKNLESFTRQRKIEKATNLTKEIMRVVLALLAENYSFLIPLRSIGITVSKLEEDREEVQLSFFDNEEDRITERKLEETVDQIRARYGFHKLKRCCMLEDNDLTNFNPKGDHIIHPVSFF